MILTVSGAMATASLAAASGRQRKVTSDLEIISRRASGSLRSASSMRSSSIPARADRRSVILRPVVPSRPSMNTLVMNKGLPTRMNMYALYFEYICASSTFPTFYRAGCIYGNRAYCKNMPVAELLKSQPILYLILPKDAIYMKVRNRCSFLSKPESSG